MSVRSRLKANPVAYGALLAALSTASHAGDLTINGTVTSPVLTSQAANGSPGNVTIAVNAQVNIAAAGAAVTIDSNNSVLNSGIIQNTGQSGAIAVHIEASHSGDFINSGANQGRMNVTGLGTGNFGILLDGPGVFTGNITIEPGGTFQVFGDRAVGIGIESALSGNLSVGVLNAIGPGATGILTSAPIDGTLSVTGGVSSAGTNTFTVTEVDPVSGSAIAVGASITKGILIAGPASAGDLTGFASVSSSGFLPTIAISPSIGGNVSDVVISPLSVDATNPSFSFINRGSVTASANDPGISTQALLVGEAGTATHTVTLSGGIYNRGTIIASAESDNTFASTASPAPADAMAVEIGNGAVVLPGSSTAAFLNEGTVGASVTGNQPAMSTGILIAAGGNLPSIVNTGNVTVSAASTDTSVANLTSYGIRDLSGTLTSLANAGAIVTVATPLDNGAQRTVAIDMSSGANESIVNSGVIRGDVLLGSGNSTLSMDHANASMTGALAFAGGTLDVEISKTGQGGTLATDSAHATTLNVGGNGTVVFAVNNRTSLTEPLMDVAEDARFGAGSHISVVPTSFLPASATYTLVQAGGNLSFADLSATAVNLVPFVYRGNVSLSPDNHDLILTLQRKTAAELGLTGNAAQIYEPLAAAALKENAYGAALLSVSNANDLTVALNSAVPDIAGGVRALAVAMTDQATGVIGARERAMIAAPANTRDDFRFWGQEYYNVVSRNSTAVEAGYSGAGLGAAAGVEWGALATGRYGVGVSFFSSQEVETHPRDTKTDGDWLLASAYAAWRRNNFFFTPQVEAGYGGFRSRRSVAARTFFATSRATWSSYVGSGGATAGYIFDLGFVKVIPQLAFDGLYVYESAYNEIGANGLGLSLDPQSQKSVRAFAGVMAQGSFMWSNGNVLPQLLAGWSHEFMDSPATIDGSFEAAPGSPFRLVGPTVDTDRIIGGASVAYVFGNWSAGFNYDAAESTRSFAQSATVSLTSRF